MNCFFDKKRMLTVCCDAAEATCVHLAVQDLMSDLHERSGRNAARCDHLPTADMRDVLLVTTASSLALAALGIDASAIVGKEEHFMIVPFEKGLAIIGSDRRGTMWGVYECCRCCLGVDPLYLWTDHEPRQVESIPLPEQAIIDGPHTFRYRGWFINDEDLIEGFCKQGVPEKGYHFQQDYRLMLDMLIETALRLKQNILIPCSHLDILRPEDEAVMARITERGLYVSMHHQEPVGVHQFTLDRIWAEKGGTGNVNFIDNTDFYRETWQKYIHHWAKYDGVIWQLGLRGHGDRPVWYQNDRVPDSTEARGKLISDDIQMQMDVREYLIGIYECAVREYDLDGLKLDFIDQFEDRNHLPLHPDMDFACVQEATERLMTDVMENVRAIKPDIMIEFRQRYIGPAMHRFGNMFRVGDCATDIVMNRVCLTGLRLLGGGTASHSDMLTWNHDESAEDAALQILNSIFGVVQFSQIIADMPEAHLRMTKFWLDFARENERVLLHSAFIPMEPQFMYPVIKAQDESTAIIGVYALNKIVDIDGIRQQVKLINATKADKLYLHFGSTYEAHMIIRNTMGNVVRTENVTFQPGIAAVSVPCSGLVELQLH